MSHATPRREDTPAHRALLKQRVDVETLESRRVMCASCTALTAYLAEMSADGNDASADLTTAIVAPGEADAVAAVEGAGSCGDTGGCCCEGCREAVAPGSAQSSAESFALATSGLDAADGLRAARSATAVRKAAATVPQVWINAPNYGIRGQDAVFTVSLDKAPGAKPVTVFYKTQNGGAAAGKDFLARTGKITFTGQETTKEIRVPIKADAPVRSPKPADFSVVLSAPGNAKIVESRAVTSIASDTPGFQIEINFLGNVPPIVQGAAKAAVNKWQSVITGDLPSVVIGNRFIDDFVMNVKMGLLGGVSSDGEGGALANAFPMAPDAAKVAIRKDGSGNTAYMGTTGIDPADIDFAGLQAVLMHEMGHALGIGAFWRYHLIPRLQFPDLGLIKDIDSDAPQYVGKNAVAKYGAYFPGTNVTSVPVQPFVLGHWDEEHLGTELMTPFAEEEPPMPLSDVTIAALADLGYQVNYSRREFWNPDGPMAGTTNDQGGGSGSSGDLTSARFLTDVTWGFEIVVRRVGTTDGSRVVAVSTQPVAEAPKAAAAVEAAQPVEQPAAIVPRRIVFRTASAAGQRTFNAPVASAFRGFR